VGDRAEVLGCLLAHGVEEAMVVGIADPPATRACYDAGVDAVLDLSIGASLDPAGSVPVRVSGRVKFLLGGVDARERLAVVRVGGVDVVLSARRRPFHEISDFTAMGLDPLAAKIVVVKSGYLVPEIAAIAKPALMALSPGVVNQDIAAIPVRHVGRPAFPWDRDFAWTPQFQLSARYGA
jgi:microcystin degradation protein MlrC